MDQQTNQNLFDLQFDHIVNGYLGETAKWAKFLAILGFIFCALMVIIALFAGTILGTVMSSMGGGGAGMIGGGMLSAIYLVLTLVYFFPCLYLYKFATQVQSAIHSNEQIKLQNSFRNLKACFKFMGILFIIIMCFYVLGIIGFLVGSAFM